jgi:hypothetical protein
VGSNPIGWHVIALLYRWAGVLFFVYALVLLWPHLESHLQWLGALMLVYPGFLQQAQSATKVRHIATFFLFALSLYLMILAEKRPKQARYLYPLSWLTVFIHLFTTEYFSGLELIRPLLLWILIAGSNQKTRDALARVAIKYVPYLLITAFFFWCRLVYFPVSFHTMSRVREINTFMGGFQSSLVSTVLGLVNTALNDLIYLTLQVWVNAIINFDGFTFQSRVAWFAFGLGILLTGCFAFFHDIKDGETSNNSSTASVFAAGFIAFALGGMPIWAIGKDISSGGWADRFALAPLLGACLMVLALLLWFVRPSAQKFMLGFLLVFSIAAQVWTINVYRRDWQTQLDYYWQLYWRAPALRSGTALFSSEQPSLSVTHYADVTYALNVLYNYETENGSLPYWYFSRTFFDYRQNIPINRRLRNLEFDGNTSDGIAVLHQTGVSCLRVLDTVYVGDPLYTEGQDALIALSNLSRIIPDPEAVGPDPDIFGPEPAHEWCYFFEKADLARQTKDWQTVIDLYQQAKKAGFAPDFGAEYVPFIEAYAQRGDWQKAYELTLAAQKKNSGLKKMLCTNWQRLSAIPSADPKVIEKVKQSVACTNF